MTQLQPATPDTTSLSGFAAMFEASETTAGVEIGGEGQIVSGTVVQVHHDSVIVDIGGKSEGVISKSEFVGADGTFGVKVGDKVDVFIESRESDDGLISLSKEKADKMKVWDEISAACERDEIIEGTISQRVKGGLSVTIRGGVKAFLPGSQVDLRPIRNLEKLIGQTYEFKVIKFNKKRGNIVLSRRVLLERERDQMKQKTLQTLEEGMTVTGTIKNLTEYGAFVDLGGIDGLLHITDMSWGRVNHPSEVFKVGDEVTVKVLKYNAETERVSLGMKQTQEDPWNHVEEAYPLGKRVRGKVMSLTDYGAFVELEPGVEGLIHVSEMSWTKKVKHPADLYNKGDDVEAIILSINHDEKKVSLGVKQLWDDPWPDLFSKYKPGTVVEDALVLSVPEYGAFVRIVEGIEGMIPSNEIPAGTELTPGMKVKAEVQNLDTVDRRVTLSMRRPGESVEAEHIQVLKRESSGKGATLGDVFKDKLAGLKA